MVVGMARYPVLKSNTAFRTLYYRGRAQVHPALITYTRKSRVKDEQGRPIIRMGITTGKKVGKAVRRNRCRRIIRAAYDSLYPELHGGWDIVFVARARMLSMKSSELVPIMRRHLHEAGLL